MYPLHELFYPTSIAVIGASRRSESVGGSLFLNLLMNSYQGILYPVNPKAAHVSGVRCYPSIREVPGSVDLAVVIVPSVFVPKTLEDCGKRGIRHAIVISAGFKEVDQEGERLETQVKQILRRYKMRLIGPNCLGVINTDPASSMNATFGRTMPKGGNIAFISQSGALCTAVLDYAKGEDIGFSKFISMGNKADINENDLLLLLKEDPQTKVILLYLEDLADGRRFREIAREITGEAELPKPILAIKSGRTPQGAKAASSHTGSLMGSDEVYDAVFAQCGVLRVDTIAELFEYARAFSRQPLPSGKRVAIVTNAGGPGIVATDACVRYGLEMAPLSQKTVQRLKGALPPTANLSNPVDLIGDARHDRYEAALQAILRDPSVDGVMVILTPQAMTDIEEIAHAIGKRSHGSRKPVLGCFMGVVDVSKGVKILESYGVPQYKYPEAAARTLAAMHSYGWWLHRPRTKFRRFRAQRVWAQRFIHRARRSGRSYLPEFEAMEILSRYGFPLLKSSLCKDSAEAARAASGIGYPVALKIASGDIVHKFDAGGVVLGIENEKNLQKSYDRMMRTVRAKYPKAKIQGVTVQEMAGSGQELFLGMKRDPHFGAILLFGLGGIYVEALRDIAYRVAPIRELGAERMIEGIRGYPILKGIRGQKPSDLQAVAECILRLSQLAVELEGIEELDINPLITYAKGNGCRVVDCRMLLRAYP